MAVISNYFSQVIHNIKTIPLYPCCYTCFFVLMIFFNKDFYFLLNGKKNVHYHRGFPIVMCITICTMCNDQLHPCFLNLISISSKFVLNINIGNIQLLVRL